MGNALSNLTVADSTSAAAVFKALKDVGVDKKMVDFLDSQGASFFMTNNGVLKLVSPHKYVIATMEVGSKHIKKSAQGMVQKGVKHMGGMPESGSFSEPESESPLAAALAKASTGTSMVFEGNMKKDKLVPLRDAVLLYQPVSGTNQDSRYFLVCNLENKIKVGARWSTQGHLSVRVEGDTGALKNKAAAIVALGLNKGSETHFSVHMNGVSNEFIAAQVIGGISLGLGMNPVTPVVSMKKIFGMGD